MGPIGIQELVLLAVLVSLPLVIAGVVVWVVLAVGKRSAAKRRTPPTLPPTR